VVGCQTATEARRLNPAVATLNLIGGAPAPICLIWSTRASLGRAVDVDPGRCEELVGLGDSLTGQLHMQPQGILVRVDLDHRHLMGVVSDVDPEVQHAWMVGVQKRAQLPADFLGKVEFARCDGVRADIDE
jgi:hypothetical protein